jgi:dipeptidyl aminopeptidase/acylaminoacyl peptidase
VLVACLLALCTQGMPPGHRLAHAQADAQTPFSIDQVLSAPFPSNLVAAPNGAAVAWVQNAEGARNIWQAEGPDFDARRITNYTQDAGQPLSDLQFTPDGQQIVFVRGGSPNRQGEHPNPRNHPDPAERALWVVDADGATAPRRLAEGHAPTMAPNGGRLAFLQEGQVWHTTLDPAAEAEPLFTVRGSAGQLRWSPSGDRLAFVSDRGDHSFVGVYARADSSLYYLDPSVDQDSNPVWSPDGAQIAFLRIPHERDDLPFMPDREALPWSIRVADATTGDGREVWKADEGPGSAFQGLSAPNQLFWGAGDRIVFPWEKTGWLHLYSVPLGGGPATHLTPGNFEVQFVTMTPDRQAMVIASNQGDIDRRHLWRVPVTGGTPTALTSGAGIEWAPVVTGDGSATAFLASGPTQPARAEIMGGDGPPRPLAPASMPADFPSDHLVTPEPVMFSAVDGMRIPGQLFRPPDLAPGEQRPAVIFFHGGSRRQMLLGFHYRGYYHNAYALNQYLASQGYVVLSVNYRSGIGYGLSFREALNYGARGASEFNDVLGAGLYLQHRPDVDPDRIGLWGGSYGGYLTALGLARASDLFAAGVDIHGVHDWNVVIENFVPSYDPAARAEAARLARQSSPMAYLDGWRSPVLLIHGDDDRNVPFSETVDLVEQLRKRDVPFEQLVFPDEVHGFLLHENWLRAYRAAADFFDRTLRGGSE